MRKAGFSDAYASNPQKLTGTKTWQDLMDKALPDKKLLQVHKKLLDSKILDHMVFPLVIEDDEIKTLLRSVGCTVRKFKHSETQTHVWFWAPNTKAQLDALDMAYKLKARLTQKVEHTVNDERDPLADLSSDDLRRLAAEDGQQPQDG